MWIGVGELEDGGIWKGVEIIWIRDDSCWEIKGFWLLWLGVILFWYDVWNFWKLWISGNLLRLIFKYCFVNEWLGSESVGI